MRLRNTKGTMVPCRFMLTAHSVCFQRISWLCGSKEDPVVHSLPVLNACNPLLGLHLLYFHIFPLDHQIHQMD